MSFRMKILVLRFKFPKNLKPIEGLLKNKSALVRKPEDKFLTKTVTDPVHRHSVTMTHWTYTGDIALNMDIAFLTPKMEQRVYTIVLSYPPRRYQSEIKQYAEEMSVKYWFLARWILEQTKWQISDGLVPASWKQIYFFIDKFLDKIPFPGICKHCYTYISTSTFQYHKN